jgi:hypothetical protein
MLESDARLWLNHTPSYHVCNPEASGLRSNGYFRGLISVCEFGRKDLALGTFAHVSCVAGRSFLAPRVSPRIVSCSPLPQPLPP